MIRLFNSLTQQKEPFEPRDPGKAGIYCCGPTVYNLVHIGNARPYVTFAVLRSLAPRPRPRVTLVTNITDVDDKIIKQANERGTRLGGGRWRTYTAAYVEDTDRLGIPRPDVEPKATETIPEIIDLVCQLIDDGHAYAARRQRLLPGRAASPDYGKLSSSSASTSSRRACASTTEPGKARPARLRPLEGRQARRAGLGQPLGQGPARLAHRVLGDGRCATSAPGFDVHGGGRDLDLPAPRERDRPERGRAATALRQGLDAQRHDPQRRREDGQERRQHLPAARGARPLRPGGRAHVLPAPTHYRSPLEFCTEKLDEAKAAYGRFARALADIDFRVANAGRAAARGEWPGPHAARRGRPPAPSPSAWTTTSTPPAPSASSSAWSARCIAT